ncbi:Dabb family protein [Chishuiella sp.]|uniref:Dabb family protein n=1 Tax=Chishuiella sp. TaxID=1969467 RepID=UPI0028A71DC2|nr:Dabb family protein [Chishuiella sp.]
MTTTKKLRSLALVGLMTLLCSSAVFGQSKKHNHKDKPVYFHYLVFWLKPDLSKEQVAEFTNFFEGLKQLPYQKNLRYGTPADSTPRSVLDKTYTYNASMEFDSLEELEKYGQLPAHLALVAKYKPYFEKMLVQDTVYNQ